MSLERIGKYRIVAKVGEGAMGEVYKAHDPLLNRFVALKTISPALAADAQFRERFKHEAQSAAGLNHPNIITVYDFGEESGVTFLAMEFLEGTDLREAIRNHSLGHLGRKIEVMEQLCDGIGFAHSRNVWHRDLKPGNIHIQPSGHVKVLDFGLAKLAASELTRTGTVMGTPHYMAPEQLRGQKADARVDVFALGAIFYELLSGARAFEGQMHEVMQRGRDREPVPLKQRAPATPIALANLVEKAMSRDPEARFKDATEMGRAVVAAREELAGETLASPVAREDPAERTLLQSAGATIVEPPPRRSTVHGTAALDVSRHHEPQQRTVRPEMTMSSGPATEVGRRWQPLVLGGVFVAVVAAVGGLLLLRARQTAAPQVVSPTAESDQLGALTEVIVIGKLELARTDLENGDYEAAAASAKAALELDKANAEAKAILEQAERSKSELEAAVAEARDADRAGDTQRATAALGKVLRLDPRHEVIGELQARLNQAFRQQAEEARRLLAQAQAAADKARAATQPGYAAAKTLATQGDAAFERREYAAAAQKFFGARNGFEAATRAADAARVAAETAARQAAMPTPRPTSIGQLATAAPPPQPTRAPTAAATATPQLLQPSIAPPPTAVPVPTAAATASATVPPPTASPTASPTAVDAGDAAVRRVLADYERAIESQDIVLFRSLKPGLSSDEEKRLRDAFKAVKSQDVGIAVESVQVEGDRATVHVRRQDTINGRKLTLTQQTWRLARSGGAWQIVAIESR